MAPIDEHASVNATAGKRDLIRFFMIQDYHQFVSNSVENTPWTLRLNNFCVYKPSKFSLEKPSRVR
jgi:hypothetical protein